ncbi:MAG: manganese efflux pump [Clostridiales bacterium]|jgi:putative Mn2+ efflux pump MntP|nr:manganese efflux pump [Clostridiales bacterium]
MIFLILTAFSLSLDAFGIGLTYGMCNKHISFVKKIIMSFVCFLVNFIAVNLGQLVEKFFSSNLITVFATLILIIIGILFIIKSIMEFKTDKKYIKKDFKKKISVSITEIIILAFALSADSFGPSIVISTINLRPFENNIMLPLFVSVAQFLFLTFGFYLSKKFFKLKTKLNLNFLSGLLLILIALIRFWKC